MRLLGLLRDFWRKDNGQDVAEYVLLAMLFAIVSLVALTAAGTSIQTYWNGIANAILASSA